ncbi:MAG: histidine kinase [Planctomycetes bacterium]|nr:histidine kinase [Planctomycetota bacterium]
MYVKQSPRPSLVTLPVRVLMNLSFTVLLFSLVNSASAQPNVIRNITEPSQRLELTVNTSRILTLEKRVPKMVVNNPELVSVTPISANQIQIAAKKPGVTQINLWDEDDKVYTVDLMIYGDVRELEMALKRLFPESSVKVMRLTNSLVLEGFVERPEAVSPIIRLAEDYAPKIINNITVGGVQQILLKVKVMEVSRTKLRNLGIDWAQSSGSDFVASSVSGLLTSVSGTSSAYSGETFQAFIDNGNNSFLGIVDALQQNNVAKILADPTITAISGRPAHFNVGGEIPIPIPQGLGQTTIEYKSFGTQIDFVPIVLGNGNIRLEVRPRVSEPDDSRGINLNSFVVPAFTVREVDTAVELKAGQTLALAGLVQTRVESQKRGLPFLSDLPFIGAAFRSVSEEVNEVELLILVTPEFVDGMEPHQVPQCGPGMESVSPTNGQLYWGGHLEVPACGQCGPNNRGAANCGAGNTGCSSCNAGVSGVPTASGAAYISDGVVSPTPAPMQIGPMQEQLQTPYIDTGSQPIEVPTPSLELTPQTPPALQPSQPILEPGPTTGALEEPTANRSTTPWTMNQARNTLQTPYSRGNPYAPTTAQRPRVGTSTPGLMGPIGYDVE